VSAKYNGIKNGTWCPHCKKSKGQEKTIKVLEGMFPGLEIYSNYKDFVWLKTKNTGRQEIDVFIPAIKLAIEYDGEQHFGAIRCFGGVEKFKKTQELDRLKDERIAAHPEDVRFFIRLNYMDEITEELIVEKLAEAGFNREELQTKLAP
jgi:hypothetical protein